LTPFSARREGNDDESIEKVEGRLISTAAAMTIECLCKGSNLSVLSRLSGAKKLSN